MSSEKPCTCIENRRLHETEAVLLLTPARKLYVYARDCPQHGVRFEDAPGSVKDADEASGKAVDRDA